MTRTVGLLVTALLVAAIAACRPSEPKAQEVKAGEDVRRSVMTYLDERKPVENVIRDSVEYLLIEPYDNAKGHIVIFSYNLGPGSRGLENKRITALLHILPDGQVWGGAIGTVVIDEPGPNAISPAAWTWLGRPDSGDYAFYGTINKPGVRRIELTEDDGDVSDVRVLNGQKAYFIPRPHRDEQWGTQFPKALRAYDSSGREIFEWVRPKGWGMPDSVAPLKS